eukprot:COSAG05_NODE_147_length_16383_cov_266.102555_12_plen_92_part_00
MGESWLIDWESRYLGAGCHRSDIDMAVAPSGSRWPRLPPSCQYGPAGVTVGGAKALSDVLTAASVRPSPTAKHFHFLSATPANESTVLLVR